MYLRFLRRYPPKIEPMLRTCTLTCVDAVLNEKPDRDSDIPLYNTQAEVHTAWSSRIRILHNVSPKTPSGR
jgi:hypothetical protein